MTDVQRVLAALASPVRREILWRIWDDELPAGAIAAAFEVSAPTISEHLAVLRDAELVTMTVDGTTTDITPGASYTGAIVVTAA